MPTPATGYAGKGRRGATMACPVCGRVVACVPLLAHVGSESCVLGLHRRRGELYDVARGSAALRASEQLRRALEPAPEAGA